MFNLIKKELVITYSNISIFFILVLFIPLILFLREAPSADTIFIYCILSSFFISIRASFGNVDRRTEIFIQSLPVTKGDVVKSKYLSIFMHFAISSILTLIYMFVFDNATPVSIDLSSLTLGAIALSLIIIIFYASLSIPSEFAFSSKTSSLLSILLYSLFLNIFILGDIPVSKLIAIVSEKTLLVTLTIVVTYLLSMKASILIYKNKRIY